MADRGQIAGGVLDGPLAFDNAISIVAAKTKGILSAVAGRADILVVPDLESGNMLAKQLEYLAEALMTGVVVGARVPIVLTSRADTAETRAASCAIALLMAHAKRKQSESEMTEAILTINAGSSSIKFALFGRGEPLQPQAALRGEIDGIGAQPRLRAQDAGGAVLAERTFAELANLPAEAQHRRTLDFLVRWLDEHDEGWRIAAVGHRVVHGAERYAAPVLLAPADVDALAGLIPLAPLHQPTTSPASAPYRPSCPDVPQVACFDTAFHMTQPAAGAPLRPAAPPVGGGHQALRLPRPLLRIRRPRAAAAPGAGPTAASSWRTSATAPRCAPCRAQQRRHHDGLHRAGRPDDGHALRRHRPGRAAAPDGLPSAWMPRP
jgi:hypothetical protein